MRVIKRYYLEFVHSTETENYTIQSKWFKTKAVALKAYHDFFDYVSKEMTVFVMVATISEDGNYGNIDICCKITE